MARRVTSTLKSILFNKDDMTVTSKDIIGQILVDKERHIHLSGGTATAYCYDLGPTKFSSPLQQPLSLHSTTHIPAPLVPTVRPPMPRPPLPQQPPPQFYYQQYQTSAPHQPEEELLIDLSPDTDHEMTPPDDPIPLASFTPLADPLIPTPMEHEPAPTIMT